MKKARAIGLLRDIRSHLDKALVIEVNKNERKYITVENRSNHVNGVVVMKELVVKVKIDER